MWNDCIPRSVTRNGNVWYELWNNLFVWKLVKCNYDDGELEISYHLWAYAENEQWALNILMAFDVHVHVHNKFSIFVKSISSQTRMKDTKHFEDWFHPENSHPLNWPKYSSKSYALVPCTWWYWCVNVLPFRSK